LVLLQEVRGVSPVFHQIFWNGRRNYSGALLPPGQYEAVLTAADHKNRARKRHLWLSLQSASSSSPDEQYPETSAAKETPQAQAPAKPADRAKAAAKMIPHHRPSPRTPAKPAPTQSAQAPAAGKAPAAREEPKSAAAQKPPPASAGDRNAEAAPSRAGAVNFQVPFTEGASEMSQDSDSVLGHVAETMELYPLDKINLVGYAYSGETDAAALAQRRTEIVKKRLVDQYRMRPENIQTRSQVSGSQTYKVEIYIVRGG
jgi:outer membrane protein OmpA-like peptidoglycan-associated protein